ncbi:MAG TPA: ComEC/Rec2 family competence protein [Chitinophagaceae bacterium]
MFAGQTPVWKKAPFVRFLIPLVIGIALQWYLHPTLGTLYIVTLSTLPLLVSSLFLKGFTRYRFIVLHGIGVFILFFALGCLLTRFKDIRSGQWYGRYYEKGNLVKVVLQEPLVEKANSDKAIATVIALSDGHKTVFCDGDLILYFQKDPALHLNYGSQIIFSTPLQEIKNSGNPAAFDYKRYCLFQNITHQVFLKKGDFITINEKKRRLIDRILFPLRQKVLSIMRSNIPGEKEYGLAEALLIGYKDDLDKNLVQSYTNTGVVHIIAISGMHIALIYWLLAMLCKPLKRLRYSKWLIAAIIISGLWIFSLLAGAQASVVRSAVMFTCIVIGGQISRKASIYNTLAASAFILLCYDPFWLWDVGFQLSYAAVLSIVIFSKPIYHWFYIKNKILDSIWKLNAVSIAAQLLTTPFSLYHFHQFPNFFLLTNVIAVPLSSVIVLGEIFLCCISFIPFLASLSGKILHGLIWIMNSHIERIEALPYSLWSGLQIDFLQAGLLIIIVTGFSHWLLEKKKPGTWIGLLSTLLFMLARSHSFYNCERQQKIVVYDIPGHQAIDIIDGRHYLFIGDTALAADNFLNALNFKPGHILYRVNSIDHLSNIFFSGNFLEYNSKRILVADDYYDFDTVSYKLPIDLLIISKNTRLDLLKLCKTFLIRQVILDSSVPPWKTKYWKKQCDSMQLASDDIAEDGAFVMNLN